MKNKRYKRIFKEMSSEDALTFLRKHKLSLQVLVENTGKTQQSYELSALPVSFLIDQSGGIVIAKAGFSAGYVQGLEQKITALLTTK